MEACLQAEVREPSVDARERRTARLVELVAAGDDAALAALYDAFATPAYRLALRVVREPGLAEDAVQDAFLAVWRTARGYQAERASVATWIFTLVHRRAVDIRRREWRRRAAPLSDVADLGEESPDADAIVRDRVRAALAGLDPRERDVIALAYYGGLTQSQVAAQLRTPLGTVKSRTTSGLRRLERSLATG